VSKRSVQELLADFCGVKVGLGSIGKMEQTVSAAAAPAVEAASEAMTRGTWSRDRSAFVTRILTVITTLRQQGRHTLDYLTAACTAALLDQRPASLLPHPASSMA
jgi:hypothetical protein